MNSSLHVVLSVVFGHVKISVWSFCFTLNDARSKRSQGTVSVAAQSGCSGMLCLDNIQNLRCYVLYILRELIYVKNADNFEKTSLRSKIFLAILNSLFCFFK